jgi:hypothetical protein
LSRRRLMRLQQAELVEIRGDKDSCDTRIRP